MAAALDIAAAAAPAPSTPAPAGTARGDRAARTGHAAASGARTGHTAGSAAAAGAKRNSTAKDSAAPGEAGDHAGDDFDAQLDAALPGAGDGHQSGTATAAAKGHRAASRAADAEKGERSRDQVPAAAVLMPWMFVPQDATPVRADAGTGADASEDTAASTQVDASGAAANTAALAAFASVPDAPAGAEEGAAAAGNVKDAAPRHGGLKDAAFATHGNAGAGLGPAGGAGGQTFSDTAGAYAADTHAAASTGEPGDVAADRAPAAAAANAPAASTVAAAAAHATPHPMPAAQAPQAPAGDAARAEGTAPAVATVQAAAAAGEPRTDAASAAPDTPSGTAAPATRGEKPSAGGRSNPSAPRSGTRIDVTPSPGQQKEHHTPRVDASANAGSVDERRGSAPLDEAAASGPQAFAMAKVAEVPVQPDHAAAVTAGRDGQPMTTPVAGTGATGGSGAEVVLAGDVPAAATRDVPDPDTPQRLVQSMRMQFLRGGGDAVVQLRPDHLGPVTVSLRVDQGNVEARITAANPVVAEWLQSHHETLREGLQANGLTLDRLYVDRDGRSPDRRERREPPPRQRFRPASETKSTFELTI